VAATGSLTDGNTSTSQAKRFDRKFVVESRSRINN